MLVNVRFVLPLSAHGEGQEKGQEKRASDFLSGWAYSWMGFAQGWAGVEVAWGSSAILGTAAAVIKGNGSPWSRAGNVRTRKLAGLGKKTQEAPQWS